MIGFGASVRLLLEHGADRADSPIAESILENVDYLSGRLRHLDTNRAPIQIEFIVPDRLMEAWPP